ncbi:MAG: hypothetical protein ABI970_18410, partial [Chloroflexota bacterium]
MREVSYKTFWSYGGAGVKHKAPLSDFLLDVLYLMENSGVIPPLHVLNEVLKGGGNNGGMSAGTAWRPFSIKDAEYNELVEVLLQLDVIEAKKNHRYAMFPKIVVDETLHQYATHREW